MILYFSGTGNTRHCARELAKLLGDSNIRPFTTEELREPQKAAFDTSDKRVIWAFPTYSWGVAPVVADIIAKADFGEGFKAAKHYMLTTCGDDIGYADRQWRKLIENRGLTAAGAYAVQMPNTYVTLPGFDVDKPELARQKVEASQARLEEIAKDILAGNDTDMPIRLSFSWFKTRLIYPGFVKHAMSPKPFHATGGCTGCATCAKACPMHNITMVDGTPRWADSCAFCLRCYHICPRHAVAYGKATNRKGQYALYIQP